ncbi:MAG: ATP-binding cassette domain-containing protein [Desulfomicrobium sp.]|nr:ATP-binding cassette domain-containing protein [Desulfomicrobium sp.]
MLDIAKPIPPLVQVRGLKMYFPIYSGLLRRHTGDVKAVDGISFDIMPGETLGLVGESGCGKSTVGRALLRLYDITDGTVVINGTDVATLGAEDLRKARPQMQMVFQDPQASLNPRMTLADIIGEPLDEHTDWDTDRKLARIYELMDAVGLNRRFANRFPHEFSGGQRQRISIARALMVDPEFIVADEPISALDVSIQAQILNLIMDCQERFGLTYMFITHDLSVVEHISTRVAVMYLGTLCELADKKNLYGDPQHPYSRALLSAIPRLGSKGFSHMRLKGEVPTPINLPPGCVFHTRCPFTEERCRREIPALRTLQNGSRAACHALEEGRI